MSNKYDLKSLIRRSHKKILKLISNNRKKRSPKEKLDKRWLLAQKKLEESEKIIDLGCGNNPVQGATVGVDLYLKPIQRSLGVGNKIDIERMKKRGITFINTRIDKPLPFRDKEYDFAYSHHVFEHLEDPAGACKEMIRIAKAGVIITPSIFSEFLFGRSYHRWLIIEYNNTIFFFKKRAFEYSPFGEHPEWNEERKSWEVKEDTNPFDILLNEGDWYHGKESFSRLSNILKNTGTLIPH